MEENDKSKEIDEGLVISDEIKKTEKDTQGTQLKQSSIIKNKSGGKAPFFNKKSINDMREKLKEKEGQQSSLTSPINSEAIINKKEPINPTDLDKKQVKRAKLSLDEKESSNFKPLKNVTGLTFPIEINSNKSQLPIGGGIKVEDVASSIEKTIVKIEPLESNPELENLVSDLKSQQIKKQDQFVQSGYSSNIFSKNVVFIEDHVLKEPITIMSKPSKGNKEFNTLPNIPKRSKSANRILPINLNIGYPRRRIMTSHSNDGSHSSSDESSSSIHDEEGDFEEDPYELASILDVPNDFIFQCLGQLIKYGSRLEILTSDDIHVHFFQLVEPQVVTRNFRFTGLRQMMKHGNPLLDSIAYLAGNNRESVSITIYDLYVEPVQISIIDYARAAFLLYFFVLNQGSPPYNDCFIPSIISDTFEIGPQELLSVIDTLASFSLNKIDYKWIRQVNVNGLGNQIRNRISLGIAGYRYVKALSVCPPTKQLSTNQKIVYNVIYTLHRNPFKWELHPVFKSESNVSSLSINKNLINLMLDIYSPLELRRMRWSRLIPRVSLFRDLTAVEYKTLSHDMFAQCRSNILEFNTMSSLVVYNYYTITAEQMNTRGNTWHLDEVIPPDEFLYERDVDIDENNNDVDDAGIGEERENNAI